MVHESEPVQHSSDHPAGDGEISQATSSRERLFYHDVAAFNTAMDKAAESIGNAEKPNILGSVIWWGAVALLAFLYLSDWIWDWDLRRAVPGVDLVKPMWIAIIGMIIGYHAWKRHQHDRIVKKRLCLRCGMSLLQQPVDEQGTGVCPRCERDFNLGEYRRPTENRGAGFQGYIDESHFDKSMYAAAEQIRKTRGANLEFELLGWSWLALGISFGVKFVFGFNLLKWLPWDLPFHLFWLGIVFAWSGIWAFRVQRLKPSIVGHRLCFNCGYSLLHALVDATGQGRCPECAQEFIMNQYTKPPRGVAASC